jgi:DNA polymerase-3 subunit epsilon
MTREIVFDTETTGMDPLTGDRLVEIGCLELDNLIPTGRTFHKYVNPERDVPADAVAVHGITTDFLRDKPLFIDIAAELYEFLGDAVLIAHNAPFDMKFLNWELGQCGFKAIETSRVIDTLPMARRQAPGAPASLDALCKRFGIDNTKRKLHGALLDAELLAEVIWNSAVAVSKA